MDNLCHSLVGAALAECGPRHRTRYATAALVIGANLPDADVLALFTEHGLGFRRGITHGIPALLVWPFVLTGILIVWGRLTASGSRLTSHGSQRAIRPLELLKLTAIAIATHPTLDWMNVYGMRWLMPFDGTWVSADALFIVDPWLLLMLGAAWIVGRWAPRQAGPERTIPFARRMVALSMLYIVAMMTLSALGRRVAAKELALGDPTSRDLMVAPAFLESWRRQVTARMNGAYRFGRIEWLPTPRVVLEPGVMEPALELVEGLPRSVPLDDLLDWARFPFARADGNVVHVDDARYARGGRSFAGVEIRDETMRR